MKSPESRAHLSSLCALHVGPGTPFDRRRPMRTTLVACACILGVACGGSSGNQADSGPTGKSAQAQQGDAGTTNSDDGGVIGAGDAAPVDDAGPSVPGP